MPLKNDSYKDDLNVYNRVAVETFKESSNLQFYSSTLFNINLVLRKALLKYKYKYKLIYLGCA